MIFPDFRFNKGLHLCKNCNEKNPERNNKTEIFHEESKFIKTSHKHRLTKRKHSFTTQ